MIRTSFMKLSLALVCLVARVAFARDAGVELAPHAAERRAASMMEELRRLHKGAGPCFRWERRATVTEESIATTAVALQQKKVKSDEVSAVVPLFIKWTDESESKAHALSEREEFKRVVRDLATPDERAKLAANPKALEAFAEKVVSKPVDSAAAQAAFARLPKAKQTGIKDVFKAHGAALRLSFLDVVVALRKLEKPAELSGDGHDDHGHAH